MSEAPAASAEPALTLGPEERELLAEEIASLAASLADPRARERYAELARSAAAGEVAPGQLGDLERALELTLETGRARRLHGADGEQTLLRLFGRTPRGAAVRRLTEDANRALASLAGQPLRAAAFSPRGPGTFRLEIATDLCQMTLEIDRRGVTVDSVGVGV